MASQWSGGEVVSRRARPLLHVSWRPSRYAVDRVVVALGIVLICLGLAAWLR